MKIIIIRSIPNNNDNIINIIPLNNMWNGNDPDGVAHGATDGHVKGDNSTSAVHPAPTETEQKYRVETAPVISFL